MNKLSCTGANDCMAVGYESVDFAQTAVAEHFNGSAWTLQSLAGLPAGGSALSDVSCIAGSCMAVGGDLAEQWDGHSWTKLSTAISGASLSGVSCSAANTCTAAGVGLLDQANEYTPSVAERWNGTSWTVQSTPNVLTDGFANNVLESVSCPTASTCVAVGTAFSGGGTAFGILERWNGTSWTLQNVPSSLASHQPDLHGVSCTSATSCMAFGGINFSDNGNGSAGTLALKYANQAWTEVVTPIPNSDEIGLNPGAVSCRAPSACVAVGQSNFEPDPQATSGQLAFAMGFNGSKWSLQPAVSPQAQETEQELNAVSCSAPTACTAVGSLSGSPFDRWNGTSWSSQASPPLGFGTFIEGISCPSASACMAVGGTRPGSFAEDWNGSRWTFLSTPAPPSGGDDSLRAVSCSSASSCLAVGTRLSSGADHALAETWNGQSWTVTPTPPNGPELMAVSCAASNWCVAVGSNRDSNAAVADLWNGSSWRALPAVQSQQGYLTSVSCPSTADCLAIGPSSSASVSVVEHFDATSWHLEPAPAGPMDSVSCRAAGRCTAVGRTADGTSDLAAEWDGARWTTDSPVALDSRPELVAVSCPSVSGCTAVGDYSDSSNSLLPLAEQSAEPTKPAVGLLPASKVTGTTAQLNGRVDPVGLPASKCVFSWGTTTDFTSSAPCSALPGSSSGPVNVSAKLSDLVPGTTYDYRLSVTTSGGSSSGTNNFKFATLSDRGTFTFGNASISPQKSTFQANLERVNPYALQTAGTLQRLSIFLQPTGTAGSQGLQLMLYADDSGAPGALLAATKALDFKSTMGAGWYSAAVPATHLTAGRYWIGVLTGDTTGVAGWRYADVGTRDTRDTPFSGGPTDPFGATFHDTAVMSLYAAIAPDQSSGSRALHPTGKVYGKARCAARCTHGPPR